MTSVEKIKLLIPEEKDENMLNMLLERAGRTICNFCNIESVPDELEDVKIDIAVKIYNRMGQEGSTSYSEGGKSQSFGDILSADVKRELYRFRKLP